MSNRIKSSVRTNWSVNKLSVKVVIIVICVAIATFLFTSTYYKNKIDDIDISNREVRGVFIPIGSSIEAIKGLWGESDYIINNAPYSTDSNYSDDIHYYIKEKWSFRVLNGVIEDMDKITDTKFLNKQSN